MKKFSMEGEGPQIAVTVPLFLKKLWKMVNDKDAEDIIGWNSTGDGFVIYDQLQFIMKLLPQYFKHNNMASFIRQLNFYDFHKVAGLDKDEIHFTHNCFLKDLPETLVFIKRKCTSVKSKFVNNVKEEELADLLSGVKEIKTKHSMVDHELKLLKQENAALWSEINNLRVKHSKQTKIINKIIHFLISYMHSHQTSLSKRNGTAARKSNQNNVKAGPTILEIDYHNNCTVPKQAKQNSYTVTEPEQSGPITYNIDTQDMSNVQPTIESSLDEILNKVATIPAVTQQSILSSKNSTRGIQTLGKLTSNNTLGNSRANSFDNSKDYALANPTYLTDPEEILIDNTLGNPATGTLSNPALDMLYDPKGNITAIENLNSGTLVNPTLNILNKSKEGLGVSTSDSQKTSVPCRNSLQYNILENPKENLGFYVDNTQTELLTLQEMLNNLSSNELCSFFNLMENEEPNNSKGSIAGSDLENFCEVMQNEGPTNVPADRMKSNDLKEPFANEFGTVPMEYNFAPENIIPPENIVPPENVPSEDIVPPEILVDEYFNPDF